MRPAVLAFFLSLSSLLSVPAGVARAAEPSSVPGSAADATSPRAQLVGNLSWIDSKPDPAVFRANDALWYPILDRLIDDETVAPHLRRRAIVALQWSPRPEASTRLGGIAADRARDEKLRGRALRCLAARDGVSALDLLIAALDDPSRRVRKDTLLALAELGVPGRPPLRAHLEREADAGLRDLVRRLLGPDVAPTAGSR